jgi:GNAT superfamily N-acetyltransferase
VAIDVRPVTPERWDDLERLFGPVGAYSNCWCTWWRLGAKEWNDATPDERRSVLRRAVEGGSEPGLLAYDGDEPIGWVAVAPRAEYPRLNRSPHTRPVDDVPVWSITCFWIRPDRRATGVAARLLEAAVEHARAHGAPAVEGYPIDPAVRPSAPADSYTGVVAMFTNRGFDEIARRTATSRVVVRRRAR